MLRKEEELKMAADGLPAGGRKVGEALLCFLFKLCWCFGRSGEGSHFPRHFTRKLMSVWVTREADTSTMRLFGSLPSWTGGSVGSRCNRSRRGHEVPKRTFGQFAHTG